MDNKKKTRRKDTIHYIKKCWLPLTLTFLILVNIAIIPNLLNNQNIKINDMSYLIPSNYSNTSEVATSIVSSPVINEEIKASPLPQPQLEFNPIEEPTSIESQPITNNNLNSNLSTVNDKHNQNINFRFRLFLLVVFLSILIFMIILTKEQHVYEYSAKKSETIYKNYNKLPQNSFETNENL